MIRKINRFGEVSYTKNEALVTMPFIRLDNENVELLEENYRQKIKELKYSSTFIYANHFSSIRDRLQISYDLEGCVDFHHIRNIKLNNMIPFLYSMVELANQKVDILWEINNIVIDLNEKRVKALIFDFEGFNIYKKDNNLDGLKELILLALTKNNNILGKPKRADFIEQKNEVFQFSNDILSCKSVSEIENVIASYEKEVEYNLLKKENERQKKKDNNLLYKLKDKISKKPKNISPEEEIKSKLNQKANESNYKKEKNDNLLDKLTTPKSMITIMSVLIVSVILFSFVGLDDTASSEIDDTQEELKIKDKTLEAYRLYMSGKDDNIQEAYAKLDSIGYKNLPNEDKEILINWYIEQEQFTKAIATDEDSSFIVGDKIIEKYQKSDDEDSKEKAISDLEQIQSSFPENKTLNFDIASLQNKYQEIIENSDLKQYNDRRSLEVVKAYVLTNQVDELHELIKQYKEDEKSYDSLSKHADKYIDRYTEKREITEEKEELTEQLESLEKKQKSTKGKKKKKIKKEIKSIKKEIESLNKEINNIDNNIKDE